MVDILGLATALRAATTIIKNVFVFHYYICVQYSDAKVWHRVVLLPQINRAENSEPNNRARKVRRLLGSEQRLITSIKSSRKIKLN